jgi:MFS transporter, ACS family, hexuronate transporter
MTMSRMTGIDNITSQQKGSVVGAIKGLRWWIVAIIFFGTVTNYIDRSALGVLAPTLKEMWNISNQQYSYVDAAFRICYMFMQPVTGLILDMVGIKLGFTIFALLWSAASMLCAFATGWVSLAVFRGLLGAAEASVFPASIKSISQWFPKRERSLAVGIFNAGTSVGGMLAPPIVVFLLVNYSWQAAFVISGSIGIVWAGLWFFFFHLPSEHPRISPDEAALIKEGQEPVDPASARTRPSMLQIMSTRKFWAIALPRGLAEPASAILFAWMPLYLYQVHHFNVKDLAMFGWMPFLFADLGSVLGGYVSMFLIKHYNFRVNNSRIAGIGIGAVLMSITSCIGLIGNPYVAILLLCIGGFAHMMISVLLNTLSADVFSTREVGTANGLTGMVTWLAGTAFTLSVGMLVDSVGYGPLLATLGIFDILGTLIVFAWLRDRGPAGGTHRERDESRPARRRL